jgi:acyl-CoA synthetase (AMP-forming)/AMP-acid ligase II
VTSGATSTRSSDALHARVRTYARSRAADGFTFDQRSFDEIALAIHAHQRALVAPIARLNRQEATTVDAIAAAPTDLFRARRLAAHDEAADLARFRTSGTTSADTGLHALRETRTYVENALLFADAMLFPRTAPERALVLAPSSTDLPTSSLSFMIDAILAHRRLSARHLVDATLGLRSKEVLRELSSLADDPRPTVVFGTSFAFVFTLDLLEESGDQTTFPLGPGSVLMLTGGFKGRTREIPQAELRARLATLFGIDERAVVGEYGMTELTSQLYEPTLAEAPRVYRPPPWVRVQAADPDTLAPLPPGSEGIGRITDLGNVDSSVVVQTLDWVRVDDRGDVELFGRAKGAALRGCSLLVEELGRT